MKETTVQEGRHHLDLFGQGRQGFPELQEGQRGQPALCGG